MASQESDDAMDRRKQAVSHGTGKEGSIPVADETAAGGIRKEQEKSPSDATGGGESRTSPSEGWKEYLTDPKLTGICVVSLTKTKFGSDKIMFQHANERCLVYSSSSGEDEELLDIGNDYVTDYRKSKQQVYPTVQKKVILSKVFNRNKETRERGLFLAGPKDIPQNFDCNKDEHKDSFPECSSQQKSRKRNPPQPKKRVRQRKRFQKTMNVLGMERTLPPTAKCRRKEYEPKPKLSAKELRKFHNSIARNVNLAHHRRRMRDLKSLEKRQMGQTSQNKGKFQQEAGNYGIAFSPSVPRSNDELLFDLEVGLGALTLDMADSVATNSVDGSKDRYPCTSTFEDLIGTDSSPPPILERESYSPMYNLEWPQYPPDLTVYNRFDSNLGFSHSTSIEDIGQVPSTNLPFSCEVEILTGGSSSEAITRDSNSDDVDGTSNNLGESQLKLTDQPTTTNDTNFPRNQHPMRSDILHHSELLRTKNIPFEKRLENNELNANLGSESVDNKEPEYHKTTSGDLDAVIQKDADKSQVEEASDNIRVPTPPSVVITPELIHSELAWDKQSNAPKGDEEEINMEEGNVLPNEEIANNTSRDLPIESQSSIESIESAEYNPSTYTYQLTVAMNSVVSSNLATGKTAEVIGAPRQNSNELEGQFADQIGSNYSNPSPTVEEPNHSEYTETGNSISKAVDEEESYSGAMVPETDSERGKRSLEKVPNGQAEDRQLDETMWDRKSLKITQNDSDHIYTPNLAEIPFTCTEFEDILKKAKTPGEAVNQFMTLLLENEKNFAYDLENYCYADRSFLPPDSSVIHNTSTEMVTTKPSLVDLGPYYGTTSLGNEDENNRKSGEGFRLQNSENEAISDVDTGVNYGPIIRPNKRKCFTPNKRIHTKIPMCEIPNNSNNCLLSNTKELAHQASESVGQFTNILDNNQDPRNGDSRKDKPVRPLQLAQNNSNAAPTVPAEGRRKPVRPTNLTTRSPVEGLLERLENIRPLETPSTTSLDISVPSEQAQALSDLLHKNGGFRYLNSQSAPVAPKPAPSSNSLPRPGPTAPEITSISSKSRTDAASGYQLHISDSLVSTEEDNPSLLNGNISTETNKTLKLADREAQLPSISGASEQLGGQQIQQSQRFEQIRNPFPPSFATSEPNSYEMQLDRQCSNRQGSNLGEQIPRDNNTTTSQSRRRHGYTLLPPAVVNPKPQPPNLESADRTEIPVSNPPRKRQYRKRNPVAANPVPEAATSGSVEFRENPPQKRKYRKINQNSINSNSHSDSIPQPPVIVINPNYTGNAPQNNLPISFLSPINPVSSSAGPCPVPLSGHPRNRANIQSVGSSQQIPLNPYEMQIAARAQLQQRNVSHSGRIVNSNEEIRHGMNRGVDHRVYQPPQNAPHAHSSNGESPSLYNYSETSNRNPQRIQHGSRSIDLKCSQSRSGIEPYSELSILKSSVRPANTVRHPGSERRDSQIDAQHSIQSNPNFGNRRSIESNSLPPIQLLVASIRPTPNLAGSQQYNANCVQVLTNEQLEQIHGSKENLYLPGHHFPNQLQITQQLEPASNSNNYVHRHRQAVPNVPINGTIHSSNTPSNPVPPVVISHHETQANSATQPIIFDRCGNSSHNGTRVSVAPYRNNNVMRNNSHIPWPVPELLPRQRHRTPTVIVAPEAPPRTHNIQGYNALNPCTGYQRNENFSSQEMQHYYGYPRSEIDLLNDQGPHQQSPTVEQTMIPRRTSNQGNGLHQMNIPGMLPEAPQLPNFHSQSTAPYHPPMGNKQRIVRAPQYQTVTPPSSPEEIKTGLAPPTIQGPPVPENVQQWYNLYHKRLDMTRMKCVSALQVWANGYQQTSQTHPQYYEYLVAAFQMWLSTSYMPCENNRSALDLPHITCIFKQLRDQVAHLTPVQLPGENQLNLYISVAQSCLNEIVSFIETFHNNQ